MATQKIKTHVPANTSSTSTSSQCDTCPKFGTTNSGSNSDYQPEQNMAALLIQVFTDISTLKEEVQSIQLEQNNTHKFYKAATNLCNVSKNIMLLFILIPVVQLLACVAIIYYLGIQDKLPSLLTWVLSGISLLSFLEVFLNLFQINKMGSRLDELEKKIDNMTLQ